jgi:hypothetical protein
MRTANDWGCKQQGSICGAVALFLVMTPLACGSGSPSTDEKVAVAEPIANAATFGVGASSSFQNSWQQALDYAWTNSNGFWDSFNDIATGKWSYNLTSAQGWWEQPSTYGNNVNSVEFFWGDTHGGAFSNTAAYAMWDQNSLAYTAPVSGHKGMRLTVTEGFFSYACQTLVPDSAVWNRWGPVFRGGLRYATGSHGTVNDGTTLDDSGYDFADDMASESFRDAWFDGLWDFWVGQDVAVMASGTGSTITDCTNRLGGMNVYNRLNYPKYKDSAVTWLCWTTESE